MSEDLNVFPNAKSPLFGAGEDSVGIIVTPAVAGLTGDVTSTITAALSFLATQVGDTLRAANTSGSLGQSFTITYGEVINRAKIQVKQDMQANFQNAGITIQLRRGGVGGTVISSQFFKQAGFPNITVNFTITEVNRPVGSQLYTLTFIRDSTGGANGWRTFNYSPILNGEFALVDIDDTHQGFIDTVAVAGKQINAADSHTTREISVLPG